MARFEAVYLSREWIKRRKDSVGGSLAGGSRKVRHLTSGSTKTEAETWLIAGYLTRLLCGCILGVERLELKGRELQQVPRGIRESRTCSEGAREAEGILPL